jgi:hypothetical protein
MTDDAAVVDTAVAPRRPWLAVSALVLAAVGVGLGAWSLLRPAPEAPDPVVSQTGSQSAGDAKQRVCKAFQLVSDAVAIQTHADLGPDPVAQKAIAGNARLALIGGGQYLLASVGPDTPAELADPVRAFATNLQDIGISALAEVPSTDPAQGARMRDGEASRVRIAGLCV